MEEVYIYIIPEQSSLTTEDGLEWVIVWELTYSYKEYLFHLPFSEDGRETGIDSVSTLYTAGVSSDEF